jgi:triosephosphate isomerase
LLKDKFGADVSDNITIQYGASVKADNAKELFSAPDIHGASVGGAALAKPLFCRYCEGNGIENMHFKNCKLLRFFHQEKIIIK